MENFYLKSKKCMYLLKCSGKSGKWYFRSLEVTKLNENQLQLLRVHSLRLVNIWIKHSNSECIPDNNLKDKGDGWGEEGSALMCLSPKPFLFMQCLQIFLLFLHWRSGGPSVCDFYLAKQAIQKIFKFIRYKET